jgi:hypothetical protein
MTVRCPTGTLTGAGMQSTAAGVGILMTTSPPPFDVADAVGLALGDALGFAVATGTAVQPPLQAASAAKPSSSAPTDLRQRARAEPGTTWCNGMSVATSLHAMPNR